MIDLHAHLLPGIDDGPADLDTALELAQAMVDNGVSCVAVSPHLRQEMGWCNERPQVVAAVAAFQKHLADGGIALDLRPNAEHYVDELLADRVRAGLATPIDLKRYLLVEFATLGAPPDLPRYLYGLRRLGVEPLLAHVERYEFLMTNPELQRRLIEQDYLFQVDAGALTGVFGGAQKKAAWRMLDQGYAAVIASDAHGLRDVRDTLPALNKVLARRIGDQAAARLLEDNPRAILEGRSLDVGD